LKFGRDGCFEDFGHALVFVGEGGEWNAVFGSPEEGVHGEPHVMVSQDVVIACVEVAVEVGAVSSLSLNYGFWSVLGTPGVEFVAPGAEEVAWECSFNDGFDGPTLLETVLTLFDMAGEHIGAEGVVYVSTRQTEACRRGSVEICVDVLDEFEWEIQYKCFR